MRIILETFAVALLVTLGVAFQSIFINSSIQISNAKQYQSVLTHQMEGLDFSNHSIEISKQIAREDGYKELSVDKKDDNTYEVTLVKEIEIPLVGLKKDLTVSGYGKR